MKKSALILLTTICLGLSNTACQAGPVPVTQQTSSKPGVSPQNPQIRGRISVPGVPTQDLAGVEIRLENLPARTRSDQQGNFSLSGNDAQTSAVLSARKVQPDGSTLSARQAITGTGLELGSVLLKASGAIVGKVSLAGGGDLTGINVFFAGTSMGALTDAEGNFFLADVPEGVYTLTAIKAGFAPVQQSVNVSSGKPVHVELAIKTPEVSDSSRLATLTGQVKDQQGPVPDALVRLKGATQAAITDQNGQYRLQIEPQANLTLQVQRRGFVFLEQKIALQAGESLVKDLLLEKDPEAPPGTLTGTLTDDSGQPLSEAIVETRPATKAVTTDKNGRFEIPDVLPGSYYLTGKQNGQLKASRFIGLDGGQTIDVPLKGLVINGNNAKVCDQQNINNININIPGAQVTVTVNNQNECKITAP